MRNIIAIIAGLLWAATAEASIQFVSAELTAYSFAQMEGDDPSNSGGSTNTVNAPPFRVESGGAGAHRVGSVGEVYAGANASLELTHGPFAGGTGYGFFARGDLWTDYGWTGAPEFAAVLDAKVTLALTFRVTDQAATGFLNAYITDYASAYVYATFNLQDAGSGTSLYSATDYLSVDPLILPVGTYQFLATWGQHFSGARYDPMNAWSGPHMIFVFENIPAPIQATVPELASMQVWWVLSVVGIGGGFRRRSRL